MTALPRWHAVITYRGLRGPIDVEHDIDEIDELHLLVERGPHWDTVVSIVITRNIPPGANRTLTVEEAARL